jgi:hypothetical protein
MAGQTASSHAPLRNRNRRVAAFAVAGAAAMLGLGYA